MALKDLVEALCSDECAGRAPGTAGGKAARRIVMDAFRSAGLTPTEQPIEVGANVLATRPGKTDRWVMLAAHYDHLGKDGKDIYRGADDNAAAVAIMIEVARRLAPAPLDRGVIFAAFDAEEPPHFLQNTMGSQEWVRRPTIPLERLDLMICMDLVGHAFGPPGTPEDVRQTVFALGAERSAGTAAHVDRLSRAVPGVVLRRTDAEIIPPLSDYDAFWKKEIPFLFLSCAHGRHYHTPEDTPAWLDWDKMEATARWLERFVRETCARPEAKIAWAPGVRDDASTLRTLIEIGRSLMDVLPQAAEGLAFASGLLAACGKDGKLPEARRADLRMLAQVLEQGLA
jgi:Zn-dependent M28 family amino/carboxypeptidase